jgi:uncharacterized membrane protein YkoI
MTTIEFPCSPEQEDVITDHALDLGPLKIQPDERAWILAQVQRRAAGSRVKSANLDVENGKWVVTIE